MYPSLENDPDGLRYVARVVGILRHEREARRWSSLRLAEESGVHHSVISRAESGERIPGVPVLVRLCRALEVRLSEVCRRAEDDSSG
jgi:transcriptional regulator with XRE-family HTH domain